MGYHAASDMAETAQSWKGDLAQREARFVPFFVCLCLLFVSYPVASALGLGGWFRTSFMIALVAGAYLVGKTRKHLIVALGLAIPAFVLQGAAIGTDSRAVATVATAATLLCFVYLTVMSFVRVLEPGVVSTDRLIGSACVFLLLGLVWAMIYTLQFVYDQASFGGLGENPVLSDHLLYFSFVTLTTLGFGDISPLTPATRTTVWMEAVVGQLYLAILVARLVGFTSVVWGKDNPGEEA